ncbi:MAG: ACT domain-containing protein [Thermoproteota archaeon]|nr:ACT domain-containing protein [Thermoproteota archaeon]
MYIDTISVPHAVKQVIGSNGLFFQALRAGIVNYTALAQKIKPDVEKLTKTKVNLNTLVVAIKRFADALEENERKLSVPTIDGIRMSLTGSIIDLDFKTASREISEALDELIGSDKGYSMFRTNKQIRVFTEDLDEVRTIFAPTKSLEGIIREGLSKITINIPSDIQNTYNILSTVSYILSSSQIPLYNAFFSHDEIILILNVNDAAKAYEIIREELAGGRD